MKIRFLSGIISAVFVLNIIGILPVNALAIDSETYVYEKEGYTVTYKVGSEWENNRSIEVTIENTGEESILNWALKYDVGGEVYNLWNSEVYESTEDYTIIKNNGYNYEIEAGQIADYGYIVTGEETLIPDDIELCSRRIDVKSGYTVDFNVTSDWYTGFNGEITINNTSDEPIEAWTLTVDGNYDITNVWNAKLLSQNEHTYEFANQLWTTPIKPGESAAFGFTADKSATLNAATENYRLTAVVVGDTTLDDIPAEEIDYELDSDSDGLPDYYEDILGTDKNNTDTDGDGLSDGYEVLYLGTDPLKADSDDNGINDGNEDFDSDGLTNSEESELGTDPNSDDTDGDGLNDGAEKNVHGTDPLKFDSDEDGISDGDEITLGLNPSSSSTDGTPDNERTFAQTVGAESEVLSVINDDESVPFDVSLEIRAAGVAENNLSAYISGYSAVMQNDAVIGAIPEFSYSNGLTVEAVTIKFELDDSIINNTSGKYADNAELSGIRRLNIFRYFDDIDMLLPVETFCNENDNTVYCTTDSVGTYCLMDMELWIESLADEKLNEAEVSESNAASAYSDEMITAEVKVSNAASNGSDDFTVVFVLDCRSEKTASEFMLMKEEILDVSRAVFQRSPNAQIYLMKQSTSLTEGVKYSFVSNGNKNYFNDYDSVKTRIKSVLKSPVLNAVLSDAVEGVISECNLSKHTFVFSIFDEENVFYRSKSGYEALDKAIAYNVDISVISNISDDKKYGYAHDMYNKTKGIYISDTPGYAEKVLEHIYGETVSIPDDDNGEYNIILATGLRTVELDDTVTHIYADRFKSEDEQVDTDKDGLTDYKEINFGCNLIKFENGIVTLPTYGACVNYKSELTYVERGLNRFGDVIISDKLFLDYVYQEVNVLPIVSDPTSEDGDGDKYTDLYDLQPLVKDITQDEIEEINDVINELIKEYITPNPPMYYNGEIITAKNKDNEVTREYFDKYIWPYYEELMHNGALVNKHACLTGWLQEVYGYNDIEMIWHDLDTFPNILYYECANINEVGPKAIKQIIAGNYYEDDITILGTSGQIICSFFGIDVICDIRDLGYDLTHFEFSKEFALQLGCDSFALLPIVGALKPLSDVGEADKLIQKAAALKTVSEVTDNTGTIIKHSDEISTIYNSNSAKYQKEITEFISKYGNEYAEIVYSVPKYSDEIVLWCAKYGDEFYDYLKYYLKEHGNIAEIVDFNNALLKQDITELSDVLRSNRLFLAGVKAENIPKIIKTGSRSSAYIQKQVLKQPWFSYLNKEQLDAIYGQLSNKDSLIDVTSWTGKLSGGFKDKTTVEEWMAINRYLSSGKDVERIAKVNGVCTCDFIVDGLKIEFKGIETPILSRFRTNVLGYAKDCIGDASKNADVLILDCTSNNLKYTIEELTPVYKELQERFPQLSFEIWTIYGDIK